MPAFCPQALLETREQREDFLEAALDGVGIAAEVGAEVEVLADREILEDATPLRDVGDAERDDLVRLEPSEVLCATVVGERSLRRRDQARDRLEQGRLARPIRADHRDDLAAADQHVDAVESLDDSVAHLQAADVEKQRRVFAVAIAHRPAASSPR